MIPFFEKSKVDPEAAKGARTYRPRPPVRINLADFGATEALMAQADRRKALRQAWIPIGRPVALDTSASKFENLTQILLAEAYDRS